ncbi:hypothetical protein SARC_07669 [Sphaeroforma arctica JP610]|uniref:Uncharacterized protein n=1 Tax=Sphaeroforma arctica JP610 TaxID=667725 RepID=A0A0L0FVI3_9EUKA|nr:hypothetical protein SARC_07669 [Sphaeroforma arctica JP610]KNC79953.1 hypothetical protein SARC_07669 [Sphaeroforma arctica JP610]|eukprot:XP_014153855.1 hypothetical protein SARC_07669 [Sphaeroforma arctica JP610]
MAIEQLSLTYYHGRGYLKNAQISGLDEAWSLQWFYKVLNHFKAGQSTLDYIKANHQQLVARTPELQITQICSHEIQAIVDPTFRKLAKRHAKLANVPIMEQTTYLIENRRRVRERCQTDAEFQQNLLNHCIVHLLEVTLDLHPCKRTLQLRPKWAAPNTNLAATTSSADNYNMHRLSYTGPTRSAPHRAMPQLSSIGLMGQVTIARDLRSRGGNSAMQQRPNVHPPHIYQGQVRETARPDMPLQ